MPRPMGRPQNKVKYPGKLLMRLINYIFRDYKIHCIAVFILIFVGVIANVQGTMFTRDLIDKYITPFLLSDGTPNFSPLAHAIERVAVFYGIGIVATYAYNRIMINVTQGMMMNMRNELFEHMEKLPIKYFDTHAHGDIMSIYTNDIDTLRQMVSQSIYDHQCICQYVDLKYSTYGCDDDHGCNYDIWYQESRRTEREIFPGTAKKSWKSQWLY